MLGEQLEFPTALPASRPTALPVLDQRARGTTFHALTVRSVLNAPAATGMGFWSLNPYIGCEFGCTYCYARETHKWAMERAKGQEPTSSSPSPDRERGSGGEVDRERGSGGEVPAWLAFERQILVKQGAAEVLARTLDPHKLAGHSLVIGTATDPYQPAERSFRLTRQLLEQLTAYRGLSIGLITKSPLVVRDLDLLQQLTARHEVTVNISLATLDARLLRRIEARSPAPHARLRALRALTSGGIHAGMLIAPVLPGITDSRKSLAALMAAGKAAGARYVVGTALRLGPAARARFLPHLAQEFPELVERYQRRYGAAGAHGARQHVGKDYQMALSRRIRALQRQYGFPVDERPTGTPARKPASESASSRAEEEMRRWRQREGRAPREIPVREQETLWGEQQ